MFYWLSQQLAEIHTGFGVFGYITLRSILGALTALVSSIIDTRGSAVDLDFDVLELTDRASLFRWRPAQLHQQ